jgi:nitroreductase
MGVQSVALACQNLLLAAHAKGLGACWMCAALFVPELIRTTLDLPETWEPQALITLGYPAESRDSLRQPATEKTIWR